MLVPQGFHFNAAKVGIKTPGRWDLGLIFSEVPASWAGVFTQNDFKAAPVLLGLKRLRRRQTARAVLINSGCANACTGEAGLQDAEDLLTSLAELLKLAPEEILPASTGVIGSRLPVEKIKASFTELTQGLSPEKALLVAQAMMTTDTFPKMVHRRLSGTKGPVTLLGLAKGAGMIAPNMATMLAFLLTDAELPSEALASALKEAVSQSFNRISVDSDTSTNDTVYLLANGLAGQVDRKAFQEALEEVCQELAYLIVKDGEGASKLVRIKVAGARSPEEAFRLAHSVADSPLVKTAFRGEDPNWGRILVALGKLGLGLDPEQVEVWLNGVPLVHRGQGTPYEKEAQKEMSRPEFELQIHLGLGKAEAEVLTCDLSEEYVRINAEYRT